MSEVRPALPMPNTNNQNCSGCVEAREAKRTAIVAVPLTRPNPRWLKRFQDKARDLLLQRDFAWTSPSDDESHVGEPWFRVPNGDRTDNEIIEQSCQAADWMCFNRQALVIGPPMPVVNAFAGHTHQSSSYEDKLQAVKVERNIPDPDGETRIAYLRVQMPDMCTLHLELATLQGENSKLKRQQGAAAVKEYVKLSVQHARLTGQQLEGKVRIVTLEPSGRQPLQGETYKPALAPMTKRDRAAELAAIAEAKITRL